MLVLSRYRNESVLIGEGDRQVRVLVVEIRGDKVRLGFDGDPTIPIHRAEVAAAIAAQRKGCDPEGKPEGDGAPQST